MSAPVSFQGVERWLFFPQGYKHVLAVRNALMVLHLSDQPPSNLRVPVRRDTRIGSALAQHVMNPAENSAMAAALEASVREDIEKYNRIHPDLAFQESNFNTFIYLQAVDAITIQPGLPTVLTIHLNDASGGFLQRSKRIFHVEPGDGRTVEETIENLRKGLPKLVQLI